MFFVLNFLSFECPKHRSIKMNIRQQQATTTILSPEKSLFYLVVEPDPDVVEDRRRERQVLQVAKDYVTGVLVQPGFAVVRRLGKFPNKIFKKYFIPFFS